MGDCWFLFLPMNLLVLNLPTGNKRHGLCTWAPLPWRLWLEPLQLLSCRHSVPGLPPVHSPGASLGMRATDLLLASATRRRCHPSSCLKLPHHSNAATEHHAALFSSRPACPVNSVTPKDQASSSRTLFLDLRVL